ncbi:hypothetical protein C2759_10450 [Polynucleobacter sp. MG-Unter2-18]|uniref:hypothetical protein n=1 Tax=Polynucleobacter sp. MG-Unter2-18 TaxID=2081052 RepID=UPI001BFEC92F|nr:hypothetical protein [Polynucleobacter sp. MG-Unter2-18]QWD94569.1 hypothetical protein C2759_10450 [Polynucleobacter sp. MG-Unter2-18]
MRFKVIALAICLCCAVTAKGQILGALAPSPLTIALTVGQWLVKDSQKAYYVQVESTAATPAQARAEGFKLAVGQAVGTLVVAESEVKNQQLVRNEIIQYSSGYIQDFKILGETHVGSMTRVVMDVWVTESKIADRLLNVSKADGAVDGEKSAAQYRSNLNQMQSGDRLLELILNDFPSKSFDIKAGKSIVTMPARSIQIQIPINISWNKEYISSLTEVLDKVRQGRTANYYGGPNWAAVIRYKNKSDWSMSTASFRDTIKLELIESNLIKSEPLIKLIIKDEAGYHLFGQCFRYPGLSGAYLGEPVPLIGYVKDRYGNTAGQFFSYGGEFGERTNLKSADLSIFGDFKDEPVLIIDLPPNIALERLGGMSKTEITVVRGSSCR